MENDTINRRAFLRRSAAGSAGVLGAGMAGNVRNVHAAEVKKPNILYILADQWRAQATGYAGNDMVRTPNIDRLAAESINLSNAVSG